MTYTAAAVLGVLLAVLIDLVVVRTRVLLHKVFWMSYAIVVFFQLVVNGLLTGRGVVRYDPSEIVGPRIVFAPFEDLLFGFAMVVMTLTGWMWAERRADRTAGARPAERSAPRADR